MVVQEIPEDPPGNDDFRVELMRPISDRFPPLAGAGDKEHSCEIGSAAGLNPGCRASAWSKPKCDDTDHSGE